VKRRIFYSWQLFVKRTERADAAMKAARLFDLNSIEELKLKIKEKTLNVR